MRRMCCMAGAFGAFMLSAATTASAETHIWVSANGDFADSLSWSSGKGPEDWLDTDRLLFNANSQHSVTTGLNQPSVHVAALEVSPPYLGEIGSLGQSLVLQADAVQFRGAGAFWYQAVATATAFNTTIIDSVQAWAVDLSGHYDHLFIKQGPVTIRSSATVDNLFIELDERFQQTVTIQAGQSIRKTVVAGGTVDNRRRVDPGHTIHISGGLVIQSGVLSDFANYVQSGGHTEYVPSAEPPQQGGPIVELLFGELDLLQSAYPVNFRYGYVSRSAELWTFDNPLSFNLIYIATDQPSVGFLDRSDADGDGVFDLFDFCADTLETAPVDAQGSPLGDVDGDCRFTLRDFAALQNALTNPAD